MAVAAALAEARVERQEQTKPAQKAEERREAAGLGDALGFWVSLSMKAALKDQCSVRRLAGYAFGCYERESEEKAVRGRAVL